VYLGAVSAVYIERRTVIYYSFQRFEGKSGQRLTLNVLEMEIERGVQGKLEVFDGRDQSSPQIAQYEITNGTLPMGLTTTFYFMYVRFTWSIPPGKSCTILKDCISFTILVDTAIGEIFEVYLITDLISWYLDILMPYFTLMPYFNA
jgi:hypothetical protein